MLAPIGRGHSAPLGSLLEGEGANFSVFSRDATAVQLLLFDTVEDARPARIIELRPAEHRSGAYWHVFVPGVRAGQLYGYRVEGPSMPQQVKRFDRDKLLLDPYACCVAQPAGLSRSAASAPGDTVASAWRGVVVDTDTYDWQDDRPPCTAWQDTVIYELHVGNFTRHPNSGIAAAERGTFAGLMQKIPYLLELGVTAVELLPVFVFDEQSAPPGRRNVWGYQPVSWFALHPGYGSRTAPLGVVDEFRDLVKALHRAGLEIYLDVVYNHTAEGGALGPTWNLRGLANDTYYILGADGSYADYSGTGNSLRAEDPVARRMILDSLRYWRSRMHVDGFRFDLAAVLARDSQGRPIPSPPILRDIESDPALADVQRIAEAWDAAGLYRVGDFAANGWREWNGRFRDEVRRFVKGDQGMVGALAARLSGSSDLYPSQRRDARGINFVTCHDGFTLNDLVSYDRKHNEANGENNRDGANDNYSWNCGVEGASADPAIQALRRRQARNLLSLTLLAAGTPMLLMGDEILRSQGGNNNGYCLDGERAWFDWSGLLAEADMLRFARTLIALRRRGTHDWAVDQPLTAGPAGAALTPQRLEWHGVRLHEPDWSEGSHSLAATLHTRDERVLAHLLVNAWWQPLSFELPEPLGQTWRCVVDTARPSPQDACSWQQAPRLTDAAVRVAPRSLMLLLSARAGPRSPIAGSAT